MSEEEIGAIFNTLSVGVQDNTVLLSALINILIDKGIFTLEEFQDYKQKEDNRMEELIEKALSELNEVISEKLPKGKKDDSLSSFGMFGKPGEA